MEQLHSQIYQSSRRKEDDIIIKSAYDLKAHEFSQFQSRETQKINTIFYIGTKQLFSRSKREKKRYVQQRQQIYIIKQEKSKNLICQIGDKAQSRDQITNWTRKNSRQTESKLIQSQHHLGKTSCIEQGTQIITTLVILQSQKTFQIKNHQIMPSKWQEYNRLPICKRHNRNRRQNPTNTRKRYYIRMVWQQQSPHQQAKMWYTSVNIQQQRYKYLGLEINKKLDFSNYFKEINKKFYFISYKLANLRKIDNIRLNIRLFKTFNIPLYRLAFSLYHLAKMDKKNKMQNTYEQNLKFSSISQQIRATNYSTGYAEILKI